MCTMSCNAQYNLYLLLHIILHIEIKIDSGLCNSQSLQMKEGTNCTKYEYTNIQELINKV